MFYELTGSVFSTPTPKSAKSPLTGSPGKTSDRAFVIRLAEERV